MKSTETGGAESEGAACEDRPTGFGNRFFRRRARQTGRAARKPLMDRTHRLPITRQAQQLGLSRSSVYYRPVATSDLDLRTMRRIDELHLELPFSGARMLCDLLALEGWKIGRKHVTTLMRRMGIEAIYRRKNTSRPHPEHAVFPYLLRRLTIDRPNQVWAAAVTYIPMARGFVYLVAVIDGFTPKALSWRLSNTLTADFCIDALRERRWRSLAVLRALTPIRAPSSPVPSSLQL